MAIFNPYIHITVAILALLILSMNAALIYKTFRSLKFGWNSRKLTILSLAIGDLFLIYALVVLAIYLRMNPLSVSDIDMSCFTEYLAMIYRMFLLNFVHGTGLVTLAVELILQLRVRRPILQYDISCKGKIMAVIVSAFPWILGLIVVLPLTLAGIDWDNCVLEDYTQSRVKACYVVSICLPAFAALLAGILVIFVKDINDHCASHRPQQNSAREISTRSVRTPPLLSQGNDMNQNPLTSNSDPPPPYFSDVIAPPPYTVSSFPPQSVGNAHLSYIGQASTYQHHVTADYKQEKGVLICLCVVYFVCVLPFALLEVGWLMKTHKNSGQLGLYAFYMASLILMFLRSVITPTIWMKKG